MLKKSFLLMLFLLNIGNLLYAMETVKLPSAKTLSTYLCEQGFIDLVEQTNIDLTLGNAELYQIGVAVVIEKHLNIYTRYVKNPKTSASMQMRKQELIECILQDSPKGITQELIRMLKTGGGLQ